ncbi:hypothetical protein NA57DRAFT_54374 [Rhizodiscina lignyota]|uniref:Cation-transporting P-type ATPase C-terminal domain-containing protein n=1 Tax=Rhizodiscina lignyota TaxID=1504668 RepID=A0A9P4IIK0_9PEZI|nr:hypothetical protein NA57DRAFT_54374 [Rhizodiscina lignyota]
MTGNGVNDASSLKQADIPISPAPGSDIAIEPANMVLLGTFSAILEAVLYGRVVFDNLEKTIAYLRCPFRPSSSPVITLIFTFFPNIQYLGCDRVPAAHWFMRFVLDMRLLSIEELRKTVQRGYP